MRDNQRKRVYDSERALPWNHTDIIGDGSVNAITPYVAKVWRWAYKQGLTTIHHPPTLKDGRGTRLARGGPYSVNLPRWARTYTTVLHELSHSLVGAQNVAWHGPEFAKLLLRLMRRWHPLRQEASDALRAEYKQNHVRYRVTSC